MLSVETYQRLCDHARQAALMQSTLALLEWDQQTGLPTAADGYRGEQITWLAGELHACHTDPKIGDWLGQLESSPADCNSLGPAAASNIRNFRRDYDRNVRLPAELVTSLARATSSAHRIWIDARQRDDFSLFAPALTEIVNLKQQVADCDDQADCRYDVLLDEYEPGAKTAEVAGVLESLRQELVPLVQQISESSASVSDELLRRDFPIDAQAKFAKEAARQIGFDFKRGRIDVTHHPFCTEMGPNDCRITTRYDASFFSSAFFGTLHEAGHGIYEQGLPGHDYGLPTGRYCSLGIHESQSRLWENLVGRSREFWTHFFVPAVAQFPAALAGVDVDDFYRAINVVRPSLIRVEADEATYNLHIIIRFELEQELINGTLAIDDLPDAWNDRYESMLGVRPASAADGVLQDVHWSAGLFGYFPTYALGNLYASQLMETATEKLGDLAGKFATGEFGSLKDWLNGEIHARGQQLNASDLVETVTGAPLSQEPLLRHLRQKLVPIYGL